jgi:hypothetical protein
MGRVVIGMDQHKRSAATIEVIDECEQVLAKGPTALRPMAIKRC